MFVHYYSMPSEAPVGRFRPTVRGLRSIEDASLVSWLVTNQRMLHQTIQIRQTKTHPAHPYYSQPEWAIPAVKKMKLVLLITV